MLISILSIWRKITEAHAYHLNHWFCNCQIWDQEYIDLEKYSLTSQKLELNIHRINELTYLSRNLDWILFSLQYFLLRACQIPLDVWIYFHLWPNRLDARHDEWSSTCLRSERSSITTSMKLIAWMSGFFTIARNNTVEMNPGFFYECLVNTSSSVWDWIKTAIRRLSVSGVEAQWTDPTSLVSPKCIRLLVLSVLLSLCDTTRSYVSASTMCSEAGVLCFWNSFACKWFSSPSAQVEEVCCLPAVWVSSEKFRILRECSTDWLVNAAFFSLRGNNSESMEVWMYYLRSRSRSVWNHVLLQSHIHECWLSIQVQYFAHKSATQRLTTAWVLLGLEVCWKTTYLKRKGLSQTPKETNHAAARKQ